MADPKVSTQDLFGDEFAATTEKALAHEDEVEADGSEATTDGAAVPSVNGKVSRTIDLGDGSGKQVFSADTAEELLDKLTDAQINATKKIREQQFELKRTQRAQPERTARTPHEPKPLSADELFALANEIQRNPDTAFDKILQAKTGKTGAELGKFINDFEQAKAVNEADSTFLRNHSDDWVPSQQNASRMQKFLTDEKLPYTPQNLEYAFQELKESGLLDLSAPTANDAGDGKVKVQPHERRKPMSTGLKSSQASGRSTTTEEKPSAMSESEVEQLYKLPVEEARQLMTKIMRRASSSTR